MEQLSPQDAQFLYIESDNNLSHVTLVSIYDPSTVPGGKAVRFKDIISHVASRVHTQAVFTRKLQHVPMELDYPYWVDDEYFDLEAHIIHNRLPEPGDWRQFCIHMARYHSRPMDMHRPLWQMQVVEGLDRIPGLPEGCYAIATKLHHAAVDGASTLRFLSALSDIDPNGTPALDLDSLPPVAPCPAPSTLDMGVRAALANARSPLKLAGALLKSAPQIQQVLWDKFTSSSPRQEVPGTRFNTHIAPHKTFDATEFPLDDLKAIRQLVPGATINDVILAIVSGALRAYLLHHNELPDEPLVAWIPINARPGGAGDTEAPGNNISAMTAPIHTDVATAAERLQRIYESTQQAKNADSGIAARLLTDITKQFPATTQVMATHLLLRSGMASKVCNLFVSNVAGSPVPLYMNGARAVQGYGMAPLGDGMGLFIATPSYAGTVAFNVISTREIMPDIRFFVECAEASLAELKAALPKAEKRPPRKKRAASKSSGAASGLRPKRKAVKPARNKR